MGFNVEVNGSVNAPVERKLPGEPRSRSRARSAPHAYAVGDLALPEVEGPRPLSVRIAKVRLRGDGPRYVIRVADGTAEVRAAGGPVDCVTVTYPGVEGAAGADPVHSHRTC
jgi:hypothetical protein